MTSRISLLLLYPATALVNRLSFPKKFALLWLIPLLAISVALYSLSSELQDHLTSARKEVEGLALIESLAKTIQLMQKHRGLSSGILGGINSFSLERAATEHDIDAAFSSFETSLPAGSKLLESWKGISAEWKRIHAHGMQWSRLDNFSTHTQLIEKMLRYVTDIADEYYLTRDPSLDTFYLSHTANNELLGSLEQLGQIRALGSGILSEKELSEQQKSHINTLIAILNHILQPLKISMEKVVIYNPGLESTIYATYASLEQTSQRVIKKVQMHILNKQFSMTPNDFFSSTTVAIDDGYSQLSQSMLPTTRRLLQDRIQKIEVAQQAITGIALLLMLLLAYLMAAIYYATLGSIKTLSRSVTGFAHGDMQDRVKLETHDEITLLGDSFNAMADEITALIAVRQELAFYDALTKLPNRRLLNDRLSQAMVTSKRTSCYGALMFIDLDNFKPLNDKHGHAVGDLLLIEVANRLKSCVREVDTAARFGGDEFVVILNELDADKARSVSEARKVAEKIHSILSEIYVLTISHDSTRNNTVEHYCTASIGVIVFINQEENQGDILKWADAAMYQAKEAGGNTILFYDSKV